MIEIEAKAQCVNCQEWMQIEDIESIRCYDCNLQTISEEIKDAINSVMENSYLWIDKEGHIGFETEKDLETYLMGVRKGYSEAIFWICSHFAEIEFFETLEFIKPDWMKKNVPKKSI